MVYQLTVNQYYLRYPRVSYFFSVAYDRRFCGVLLWYTFVVDERLQRRRHSQFFGDVSILRRRRLRRHLLDSATILA